MPTWYLLLALAFIVANGLFVAAEFAIVKVRPTQLAELAAAGSSRARMARRITKHLDTYLSATQLGVTLASLALGSVGEPVFEKLIEPHLAFLGPYQVSVAHSLAAAIAFIIISWLHITFGELGPKYIAVGSLFPLCFWIVRLYAFFRELRI